MNPRRVVVTGLGALTPIGNSVSEYWEGLIDGKSGSAPITYFDTSDFNCLLYTSPSPRDPKTSRMPSSA